MAIIKWDEIGFKFFETGVDRGVLYIPREKATPWNGLISVNENTNIDVEPIYFDAKRINDVIILGEYSASIRSYTYPDELMELQGMLEVGPGFYLYDQPPKRFHLSYRTLVGNDLDSVNFGYKIHILYNLLITSSGTEYQSINDEIEPIEFEWDISCVPIESAFFEPTGHLVFDSNKTNSEMLSGIESLLYGDSNNDPVLPPFSYFIYLIREWVPGNPIQPFIDSGRNWG